MCVSGSDGGRRKAKKASWVTHQPIQLVLRLPKLAARRRRPLALIVDEQAVHAHDERVQDLADTQATVGVVVRARVKHGDRRRADARELAGERDGRAADRDVLRQLAGGEVVRVGRSAEVGDKLVRRDGEGRQGQGGG